MWKWFNGWSALPWNNTYFTVMVAMISPFIFLSRNWFIVFIFDEIDFSIHNWLKSISITLQSVFTQFLFYQYLWFIWMNENLIYSLLYLKYCLPVEKFDNQILNGCLALIPHTHTQTLNFNEKYCFFFLLLLLFCLRRFFYRLEISENLMYKQKSPKCKWK